MTNRSTISFPKPRSFGQQHGSKGSGRNRVFEFAQKLVSYCVFYFVCFTSQSGDRKNRFLSEPVALIKRIAALGTRLKGLLGDDAGHLISGYVMLVNRLLLKGSFIYKMNFP